MKFFSTLVFGAAALIAATFATAAPAKADNFGVYFGSDGVAIQVSNYGGGYYGGYPGYYGSHYNGYYDPRCRDRWYRKHYRHCRYSRGHNYYPNYYGYNYPRYNYRHHGYPRHHWKRSHHRWHGNLAISMAGTAATVGVAMTAGEATAVTIADIAADIDRVRSSEARCGGGPSFSVALQVGA